MKRFIENNTYHLVYENLQEFFDMTDANNPPSWKNRKNKMKGNTKSEWTYGEDESGTKYREQRQNPKRGKDMCEKEVKATMVTKEYKDLVRQALTYKKKIFFDDHGGRLSVPRAIAGEDRVFVKHTKASRPTVKIAINICGSCSVDEEAFIKVAKTAVPTIYAIEAAGIPTEVYYTAFASGTHISSDFDHTATHVKIKSAQERFSWTTFAPVFCLGSYRESIFNSWFSSDYQADEGLGCPMDDIQLSKQGNYGYTSIIGLNAVGPVDTVKTIFDNLSKKATN